MFTNSQIEYMRALGLNINFNNISDDEWVEIENAVATKLEISGFDENYEPTEDGKMCESIIDVISKNNY